MSSSFKILALEFISSSEYLKKKIGFWIKKGISKFLKRDFTNYMLFLLKKAIFIFYAPTHI